MPTHHLPAWITKSVTSLTNSHRTPSVLMGHLAIKEFGCGGVNGGEVGRGTSPYHLPAPNGDAQGDSAGPSI